MFGIRPLTFTIASFLVTFWHPTSIGKVIFNNFSRMPPIKQSLMPYIKPLKADGILRSKFKELLQKEKDEEGFSSLIDLLHTTKASFHWPFPILDHAYNSSLDSLYDSFLGLNMWSSSLYLPYFSHNDLDIVVHEDLIVNQIICNLYYFVSLCFDQFEAHTFLPMLNEPQDKIQCPISREVSKKIHTQHWKQKDLGKHKKKEKNLWPGAVSGTTRTLGNLGTSGPTSFSLIDYLYQSFVVDNIFSDLL